MNLISLFSQALTNKEYLSFEPSEGQASKKIVCGKEKKMRLQELFKSLSEYLSNAAAQSQLSPQETIQLKEYTARLYERYKQTSNKWPRQLLKILAKFTPSFLKRFLPACFSNQIEETEKATERAYSGCVNTLTDTIHQKRGFSNWFTTLSEEELCSKFFQRDENGARAIDNIHPDHLEKKEFIELIRIQNLAKNAGFNSEWPSQWANRREGLNQVKSLYLDLCKMDSPLEIKKHIFSQPLANEEQMALLAAIISEKYFPLSDLQMNEKELLELCEHLRVVVLSAPLSASLGQQIIKKLMKPYKLYARLTSEFLAGLVSLEKCILLYCPKSEITSLPSLPNCIVLFCNDCISLTSLPALPSCKNLDCSNCINLSLLPDLPNCTNLDCSNCTTLQSISNLPLCQKLFCHGCTALQSISNLPLCKLLDCENCTSLTSISALPLCRRLSCSQCESLTSLPDLPLGISLECWDCTSLKNIPQLTPGGTVYRENPNDA